MKAKVSLMSQSTSNGTDKTLLGAKLQHVERYAFRCGLRADFDSFKKALNDPRVLELADRATTDYTTTHVLHGFIEGLFFDPLDTHPYPTFYAEDVLDVIYSCNFFSKLLTQPVPNANVPRNLCRRKIAAFSDEATPLAYTVYSYLLKTNYGYNLEVNYTLRKKPKK